MKIAAWKDTMSIERRGDEIRFVLRRGPVKFSFSMPVAEAAWFGRWLLAQEPVDAP